MEITQNSGYPVSNINSWRGNQKQITKDKFSLHRISIPGHMIYVHVSQPSIWKITNLFKNTKLKVAYHSSNIIINLAIIQCTQGRAK
jgi:hypothetical protein